MGTLGLALLLAGCHSGGPVPFKNVKPIKENEFEAEVVGSSVPVIVDFYAPWCGACRMLAPSLDREAGLYRGRVKFVSVNVDDADALAQKFGVEKIPTLLFVKEGKVIDKHTGLLMPGALKSRLKSFAGSENK